MKLLLSTLSLLTLLASLASAQNPNKCGNANAPDYWCEYVGQSCVWPYSGCPNYWGLADVWQCHWTDPTYGAESCPWTWFGPQACSPTCKDLTGAARPPKDRWWWKHGKPAELAIERTPEEVPAWTAVNMLKTMFAGMLPNGNAGLRSGPYGFWTSLKGDSK